MSQAHVDFWEMEHRSATWVYLVNVDVHKHHLFLVLPQRPSVWRAHTLALDRDVGQPLAVGVTPLVLTSSPEKWG